MSSRTLCPKFEKAMSIFSKRWTGLIIHQMLDGPRRFCHIESSLPISGRLLSERLKELELLEIVDRKVYPETPVRIEYSLTKKGESLAPVIDAIQNWADDWVSLENSEEK